MYIFDFYCINGKPHRKSRFRSPLICIFTLQQTQLNFAMIRLLNKQNLLMTRSIYIDFRFRETFAVTSVNEISINIMQINVDWKFLKSCSCHYIESFVECALHRMQKGALKRCIITIYCLISNLFLALTLLDFVN